MRPHSLVFARCFEVHTVFFVSSTMGVHATKVCIFLASWYFALLDIDMMTLLHAVCLAMLRFPIPCLVCPKSVLSRNVCFLIMGQCSRSLSLSSSLAFTHDLCLQIVLYSAYCPQEIWMTLIYLGTSMGFSFCHGLQKKNSMRAQPMCIICMKWVPDIRHRKVNGLQQDVGLHLTWLSVGLFYYTETKYWEGDMPFPDYY